MIIMIIIIILLMLIIVIIIMVISLAPYLIDKGEHTAFYEIT